MAFQGANSLCFVMLSVPRVRMSQVYNQIDLIPAGTARRDALRLTKKKAKSLPRVTAYATARCAPSPSILSADAS